MEEDDWRTVQRRNQLRGKESRHDEVTPVRFKSSRVGDYVARGSCCARGVRSLRQVPLKPKALGIQGAGLANKLEKLSAAAVRVGAERLLGNLADRAVGQVALEL